MSLIFEIFTYLITGYMLFVNSLAGFIADNLAIAEKTIKNDVSKNTGEELIELPSQYEKGGSIPDILIKNAAYQKAAVGESALPALSASPEEAIVNIFCTYKTNEYERTTTGTGFFVHEDGIILTNAHVAQFLLLANIIGESECIIRTGNPATDTYIADLLYISPAWLREYAHIVNEEMPRGTGERDYALIYVNSALNNKPMPAKFPAIKFDPELLRTSITGTEVVAAGYPAGVLQETGQVTPLTPKTATTTVTELMTFGSNYADIFSIAGSAVGESGASGGPVVNQAGNAIGVIVTKGDDAQFGTGSLRAITISYIDRTIREETGFGLKENLQGNLPYRAELYKQTMVPFLELILRWEIDK